MNIADLPADSYSFTPAAGATPQSGGFNFGTMKVGIAPSASNPPSLGQKIASFGGGIVKQLSNNNSSLSKATTDLGNGLVAPISYAGTRIAQAGMSLAEPFLSKNAQQAIENSNAQPQQTVGAPVLPQAQGTKGAEQIAGNFAEGIGEAAGGEIAPEVGTAGSLGSRALNGAIGAGTAGGLMTGGAAAANEEGAGKVAKATGLGTAGGIALGAGIPLIGAAASEGADAAQSAATNAKFAVDDAVVPKGTSSLHIPEKGIYAKITPEQQAFLKNETGNIPFTAEDRPHLTPNSSLEGKATRVSLDDLKAQSPNAKAALDAFDKQAAKSAPVKDTIHSDLTPDFNPKTMNAYDKIKTPDGKTAFRTTEGQGVTGQVKVTQSAAENAAEKEVKASVPDYNSNRTFRSKTQAVDKAISNEAEAMRGRLQQLDKTNPLNKDEAINTVQKNVFDQMSGDARDAVVNRGKLSTNPYRDPVEPPETSGKASPSLVRAYGKDMADAMAKYDGTREGILDLKQQGDQLYKNYRGKAAFGSDPANELDQMNTNIRNYLTKELDESSKDAGITASLKKQSNLYTARDILNAKAAREGQSAIERALDKTPIVRRLGSRIAMREAASGLIKGAGYAAAGIGAGLGIAAATKKK